MCASSPCLVQLLEGRCGRIATSDVLVDFEPEAEVGLLEYAGLMLDLSDLLGRTVDLVSKRGLKPLIRDSVLREARPVYAA